MNLYELVKSNIFADVLKNKCHHCCAIKNWLRLMLPILAINCNWKCTITNLTLFRNKEKLQFFLLWKNVIFQTSLIFRVKSSKVTLPNCTLNVITSNLVLSANNTPLSSYWFTNTNTIHTMKRLKTSVDVSDLFLSNF